MMLVTSKYMQISQILRPNHIKSSMVLNRSTQLLQHDGFSQRRSFRVGRNPTRTDSNSHWWQKVVGVGAFGYTAVKMKGLTVFVPLLKVAKVGPLLSMGASMAAYGWLFGWKFGVGMVSLIFVHELGHGLMMRRIGVPAGPMTFIPFFGAVIEMRGRPVSSYHDALIAMGGPVLGTVATLPILGYGLMTGDQFALARSHWGCMVNLFNLLPIGMLDGGRIAGALSKWTLPLGIGLSGLGIYAFPNNPIMYITAISACASTYSRFFGSGSQDSEFWKMEFDKQLLVGTSYASLIAVLAAGMQINDAQRKSPEELRRELIPRSEWDQNQELFAWTDDSYFFTEEKNRWSV